MGWGEPSKRSDLEPPLLYPLSTDVVLEPVAMLCFFELGKSKCNRFGFFVFVGDVGDMSCEAITSTFTSAGCGEAMESCPLAICRSELELIGLLAKRFCPLCCLPRNEQKSRFCLRPAKGDPGSDLGWVVQGVIGGDS